MKLLWCVGVLLVSVTLAKIQTPTASERSIGHRIHVDDMNQEVVAKHRQKLQMHHKEFMAKLQAAESAPVKNQGAAKMPSFFEKGSVVQPVAARLSKGELEAFLRKLSADCEKQFTQLLKGEGQVHKLHQFGTKDHNTTESSCQDLEGALCSTHARVQQRAESKVAGRRLVSKSDVKGESCLPRSCIQDHDLHLVAGMMQQKAVESLGASMAGEQPAEVLLDVDCSASGGASYSSTSEWSMEEAGPTHSAATIPSFILPIFVIMAILSS